MTTINAVQPRVRATFRPQNRVILTVWSPKRVVFVKPRCAHDVKSLFCPNYDSRFCTGLGWRPDDTSRARIKQQGTIQILKMVKFHIVICKICNSVGRIMTQYPLHYTLKRCGSHATLSKRFVYLTENSRKSFHKAFTRWWFMSVLIIFNQNYDLLCTHLFRLLQCAL